MYSLYVSLLHEYKIPNTLPKINVNAKMCTRIKFHNVRHIRHSFDVSLCVFKAHSQSNIQKDASQWLDDYA